jgi:phage recombination protein Bet
MNQLQVAQDTPLASQFTPEQMQLITSTVARGASPQELQLFLYRCKLMGLNPLKPGQIHFVKYGNSPGTIVVGIEGFRSIAGRTGKLSGIERGVNKDENGRVIEGWAKVYRSDWAHPAFETVPMAEYNTGKAMWAKMPETMIKKVAEAAALRMAFPDDLGGVYENSELDQAQKSDPVEEHNRVLELEGQTKSMEYTIPFGSFKGRTPESALRVYGPEKLARSVELTEEKIASKVPYANTNLDEMREYVAVISRLLAAQERGEIDGAEDAAGLDYDAPDHHKGMPIEDPQPKFGQFKGGFVKREE